MIADNIDHKQYSKPRAFNLKLIRYVVYNTPTLFATVFAKRKLGNLSTPNSLRVITH